MLNRYENAEELPIFQAVQRTIPEEFYNSFESLA